MSKQNILVTGGCGFIGSHTVVELLTKGCNIIIIDNLSNSSDKVIDHIKTIISESKYNEYLTEKSIKFYKNDCCDIIALDKIFMENKIDGVIHFAGFKAVSESIENPVLYYNNNIVSTLNLIQTMQKYNCYRLIFSSSATIYGNRPSPLYESNDNTSISSLTNPYGKTKYIIEEILRDVCMANKKFKVISLRYFNPIGAHKSGLLNENPKGIPNNLMPYIIKVVNKELPCLNIFGSDYNTRDGTCTRDYIHVCDLAVAHVLALEYLSNTNNINIEFINVGTGNDTSVLELVNTFEKVNNVKINYKLTNRREGDIDIVYSDVTKLKKLFKWVPKYTIEEMCIDSYTKMR